MRKIRVYVDTSVFGGTQDEEFAEESQRFFRMVQKGTFAAILSEQTLRELSGSPDSVQAVWQNLPPGSVENIPIDDEIAELAYEYIMAEVLGKASIGDALHVAAATVTGADLILSWNFKHIVNFNRIRGYNSVNIRMGYRAMTILSPKEVNDEDEENQDI
jgi:hypothetical protein